MNICIDVCLISSLVNLKNPLWARAWYTIDVVLHDDFPRF